MSEKDAATDRASLVPGVHRLIRAIDGKEGPFSGTLVAFEESVAVCVEADELRGWAGWAFSGSEHVCGVLDLRRRVDGHDALLPWCTQRVESFLGRRDVSDAPLTPGELGTLVASMLRGVRELGADADVLGDWWLTGDGRPLFVHGEGGSARARTGALIERVAHQQTDRATARILEEAAAALRQPRHPVEDDRRWEEHLFARAAPRALQLDVFAPERVSDVAPRLVAADAATREVESRRRRRAAVPNRRTEPKGELAIGRVLHASTAGMRAHLERLRERMAAHQSRRGRAEARARTEDAPKPKPKASHRRSVLVAGALGAVVLIVGLLWPSDGGEAPAEATSQNMETPDGPVDPSSDPVGPAGDTVSHDTTAPPSPTPSEARTDTGGAMDAVPALLDAISMCIRAAAEQCSEAVAEGARTPSDGLASLGAAGSSAALVDDYGDVAVIRLTPLETGSESTEQMMVLERHNEIWLVRDVYDVAHQPD